MSNAIAEFQERREKQNEIVLGAKNLQINRFFSLDSQAYRDGALDKRTKELLGLVASMVLRCDDCILYHVIESVKVGYSDEELYEAFNVALVVGGSIVVPHLRRAAERLAELRETGSQVIT